jgi:hypothetical protein
MAPLELAASVGLPDRLVNKQTHRCARTGEQEGRHKHDILFHAEPFVLTRKKRRYRRARRESTTSTLTKIYAKCAGLGSSTDMAGSSPPGELGRAIDGYGRRHKDLPAHQPKRAVSSLVTPYQEGIGR